MQLDSVRELYYNERASQMALSNLVREVVELRDPATVVARIKSLQDKIKAQSQAATQRPVDVRSEEFGALGRRTESLQAAKALLEDKLHLMKLSAHSAPRVDIDRIRADVEREVAAKLEADLQGRLRNLSESIRMESLQTIRSRDATIQSKDTTISSRDAQLAELREKLHVRDAQIADLKEKLHHRDNQIAELKRDPPKLLNNANKEEERRRDLHVRDAQIADLMEKVHHRDNQIAELKEIVDFMRVRDAEVENLEQVREKLMSDRAVLEQIIRTERKQREEEFNDMDANVRARDDRIQELTVLLEQKGVRVANASMMNELQRRLDAKDTEIRAKVAKIDELNQRLSLAEAKKTLNGVGHTSISQQPDLVELEQLDSLARVMGGVAEIDDLDVMRDQSAKVLQQKIHEVGQSNTSRSKSTLRLLESFHVILLRL